MARLPVQGGDSGVWGSVLNDFLQVSHNPDGSLQVSAVTAAGAVQAATTITGGDLIGSKYPNPVIAKLNGITLPSSAPVANQVLTATSATATTWSTPAGGVVLDTNGSDIQPLGTQAPGGTGKAADAGHVHPTTGLLLSANSLSELTGAASAARGHISAAASGANSDITGLSGLTTPLSIPQGGTGQGSQQAALNALSGAQSGGKYLRSDGTNTTLSSIQAGDVPTLNQNTTGNAATVTTNANLTGDVTSVGNGTTLVGTVNVESIISANNTVTSKAPLANPTFTGKVTTPALQVTTGAGTSGQILTSDTSGNATWQASSSPTLPISIANGGTNNTVAPAIGNVPAATSTTASAWVGAVNAGAWVFDVRAYGAVGNGKVVIDGAMTSGSAVLACTTSTPFTAGDVGKAIMFKGAGAAVPTTLVTTIASFTDSGHITLTANATTTISSATVMWATDDTAAVQSAINAAVTYAQARSGYAKVFIPPAANAFYGIAGALVTGGATLGNGQLTLPIIGPHANKVTLDIEGAGNFGGSVRYWNQLYPVTQGSCLVSFGVFASYNSTVPAQLTSITANGNPAVISGPSGKNGYGVSTTPIVYSNMTLNLSNLVILTTHSGSGVTYGVLNGQGIACVNISDFSYGTVGIVSLDGAGSNDFAAVSVLATGISIGILMPGNGNNDSNQLRNIVCNGGYTYALFATEHTDIHSATLLYCWSGLCLVGTYGDANNAPGGVGALHSVQATQLSIEACSFHVNIISTGAAGIGPIFHGTLDTEGTPSFRDTTAGTGLAAALGVVRMTGSPGTLTATFPTGLQIIKEQQLTGPVATPSYSLNTAQINTYGRWATVIASGGTNITGILVSGLMYGASVPTGGNAPTTIYSQAAGPISSPITFRIGPGAWWEITASSGTAPTLQWILD
jgi:hypothetical protein